ncbi:glycosyltransferase [Synechococcus sp. CS-1325]|uniref:CgeB family protein n=1 Tax=unclassified Synechococcus TaxID=2626047 RepID=UPI0021A88D52|nr:MULTISPECIES: glycosyltransferase [unclassified Synechococcus]MCT0200792.1 glycosyltransferase [Synechococcus sp. CS-1325]MCT0213831.1 glycosyltransferase [Synechococcus sp. CS-1326]MCT0233407.1 glycosyltransferase [Synechococcus sp. CS-1327]
MTDYSVYQHILYFGDSNASSTSCQRAEALLRIGCGVLVADPYALLSSRSRWKHFLDYRTGFRFLQGELYKALQADDKITHYVPDLIWVNGGQLLGPTILKWLRHKFNCPIILYQNDDPTGARDSRRFLSLLSSLPLYDLCVLVRPETELEVLACGASRVLRVWMSYDEVFHRSASVDGLPNIEQVVSFVGTLIPGEQRDRFLVEFLKVGLSLSLIGNGWQRSRMWPLLSTIYRGSALFGQAYVRALGSAAVSLGLLSHLNRDLVTTRSFEIPACGGLLCAERTSEHCLLFEDGVEAVFWNSSEECIRRCRNLLNDPQLNSVIRHAGRQHVFNLGVGNEDVCRQILAAI